MRLRKYRNIDPELYVRYTKSILDMSRSMISYLNNFQKRQQETIIANDDENLRYKNKYKQQLQLIKDCNPTFKR